MNTIHTNSIDDPTTTKDILTTLIQAKRVWTHLQKGKAPIPSEAVRERFAKAVAA